MYSTHKHQELTAVWAVKSDRIQVEVVHAFPSKCIKMPWCHGVMSVMSPISSFATPIQAAWCGTLTPGDFAVRRPGTTVKAAMVAALHRAGLAATVLSQNCQEWAVNTMIPTLENGGSAFCNMLQYASGCFGNIMEHLWNSSKTVISQWLKIQETWVCMTLGHHRFWKCLYVTATLHKFLPSIAFQPIDVLLQPAIDCNPHQRLRSSKVCAALWFSFPHAAIYNKVDWWWLMWVFLTTYLQSCRMTSGTLYGSIWHYLSKPCKI